MSSIHDQVYPMWEQWKENKDKKLLGDILDKLDPMIKSETYRVLPPTIPKTVMETQMKIQAVNALHKYDPKYGKINTFIESYLDKPKRMMYKYQNVARIPETRAIKIGTFNRAKEQLAQKLGREPSDIELADDLAWDLKEVGVMNMSLRKDIISGQFQDNPADNSREQTVYHFIAQNLTPVEFNVWKHMSGYNNAEMLSGNDIAKKMKVSPSQVTKIKNRIGEKIEKYISITNI